MTPRAVAIVLAAGSGARLGGRTHKAFVRLHGTPILVHAVRAALACPMVGSVVLAAPAGREDLAHEMIEDVGAHAVVTGGATRGASVRAALGAVSRDVDFVVVHDAARPFAIPTLFAVVLEALEQRPEVAGAVPVVPVTDTVKRVHEGYVVRTEPREELALAQTPQAFRTSALREAYERAATQGLDFSDDAALVEWAGHGVAAVPGDPGNFKVTTPQELAVAERIAEELFRG